MKRKIIALLLCFVCVSSLCFPVAADDDGYSAIISDIDKTCPTCGSALHAFWWSTSGAEVEVEISDTGKIKIPAGAGAIAHIDLKCKSCGYEKKETRLLGLDFGAEKPGKLVQAPSGIGRKDLPGYADDNGTPNYSSNGNLQVAVYPDQLDFYHDDVHSAYAKNFGTFDCPVNTRLVGDGVFFDVNGYNITANTVKADSSYDLRIKATYLLTAPVSGIYNISTKQMYGKNLMDTYYNFTNAYVDANYKTFTLSAGESISFDLVNHIAAINNLCPFTTSYYPIIFDVIPSTVTVHKQSNVNIYNNTWNGNIYVDNSNNLTYIYPQYTTVNEKNETVTNISNTPIIYNNETYQYYTYDQTTKNYYYITYPNQPTPPPTATPSPSPAPTETPSPSPSPAPVEPILPANRFRIIPNMTGNNFTDSHGTWSAFGSSQYNSSYTYFRAFTVDTSYWWTSSQEKKSGSYDREMPCWLAIEIPDPENYYIDGYVLKGAGSGIYYDDWQFQYSDDGSAWTDLDSVSDGGLKDQKEHDFNVAVHKAHKYYRWYFTKAPVSWPGLGTANLYGYNAKDVVTPTPSPSPAPTDPPSPSPAPDPGKPGGSSGSSWWDKLLSKIGDAIIDGLLGAVSAVLKLIFKLFSTILSWIIWAVSRVFDLLPFLPPGLGGLLVGGVVVCFVIGIIKFIRG